MTINAILVSPGQSFSYYAGTFTAESVENKTHSFGMQTKIVDTNGRTHIFEMMEKVTVDA